MHFWFVGLATNLHTILEGSNCTHSRDMEVPQNVKVGHVTRPRPFRPANLEICAHFNLLDISVKVRDYSLIGCQEIRKSVLR